MNENYFSKTWNLFIQKKDASPLVWVTEFEIEDSTKQFEPDETGVSVDKQFMNVIVGKSEVEQKRVVKARWEEEHPEVHVFGLAVV